MATVGQLQTSSSPSAIAVQVQLKVNGITAACKEGTQQCSYMATAAATPNITAVNVTAAQNGSRQLIIEGASFLAKPGDTSVQAAEQVSMVTGAPFVPDVSLGDMCSVARLPRLLSFQGHTVIAEEPQL